MRTSPVALLMATALSACTGTEGDLLRSVADAGRADEPPIGPPPGTWQIQLSGALDTTIDAQVYTVDMETPVSSIAELHRQGRVVLCYFSAGTRESFRADAGQFPMAAIGSQLAGFPNENWLDVRDPTVRSVMSNRIDKAAAAGCDGIHPSGVMAYSENTGFPLTRDDSLAYATWLADTVHATSLSVGLVDGDTAFAQSLLPIFDWRVVWNCIATQCTGASPFLQAGKPSYLVETGDATRAPMVCPLAKGLGLSAIIKHDSLDAFRVGCP